MRKRGREREEASGRGREKESEMGGWSEAETDTNTSKCEIIKWLTFALHSTQKYVLNNIRKVQKNAMGKLFKEH